MRLSNLLRRYKALWIPACVFLFVALLLPLEGCNRAKAKLAKTNSFENDPEEEVKESEPEDEAIGKADPTELGIQEGDIGPVKFKIDNPEFFKSGGTEQTEAAVQAGLKWMADHQLPDGHWSFRHFNQAPNCNCRGGGNPNDIAATSLALLCFIARGETHNGNDAFHRYTKVVDNGIKWLVKQQTKDGNFEGMHVMYAMGMATMALCEDYHASGNDPTLETPCRKAIKYICDAQHPRKGGWRYQYQEGPDMSVTSWQVQALKSGQLAGITIPQETQELARSFLKRDAYPEGDGYGYRMARDKNRPTMRCAGMLTRQFLLGGDLKTPEMKKGVEKILEQPPSLDFLHTYHHYYATQVIFNIQGKEWEKWNPLMRDFFVKTQDKGKIADHGHQKGSWSPGGQVYGERLGRLGITALSLLNLEVYYRHDPSHRPELGSMKKDTEKTEPVKGKK